MWSVNNIVTWRGLAENCNNYLRKGSLVSIEGRIQTGKYVNNEGRTVYTTDVVADDVRFLDSRNRVQHQAKMVAPKEGGEMVEIRDEDLPF